MTLTEICRTPVKTTSNHIPGIFYNLLVSSTDSNGNHIPSSVRFRALKTLNDPAHSEIGTGWSEPIKTSIFGHVLWSINALTDAQPPTIEVEVTQLTNEGKPSKPVIIQVHPLLNLIGFLQALNQKTPLEWKAFLIEGCHNDTYAEFASSAISTCSNSILKGLLLADDQIESLMEKCYNSNSGLANFDLVSNNENDDLVVNLSNKSLDETQVFKTLMSNLESQLEVTSTFGSALSQFVEDAQQLMQLIQLLIENEQLEMLHLFGWLGLETKWEAIGSTFSLVKASLQAGLEMAKAVGNNTNEKWGEVVSLFQGLIQKTTSGAGQVLSNALPIAQNIQQEWEKTVPELKNQFSFNHQQFEFGWISWRILHSFPQSPSGFKDLIITVLKSSNPNKLLIVFENLTTALENFDLSEELQKDINQIMSFYAQVLQGNSAEVAEKLLKGSPELEAMESLPNLVLELINTITTKSNAIPELVIAVAELVDAIMTTPLPMPFIEGIQPWFEPKKNTVNHSNGNSGICLMDCMILMMVTPSTKIFLDITGESPPEIDALKNPQTWMLDKISFFDLITLIINAYDAQHHVSEQVLDNPPPLPIPGILSQLPFEEEVFDALILFLKITSGVMSGIDATLSVYGEFEETEATISGENKIDDLANDVDWKPVVESLIQCCLSSFSYSLKCNINLLETAKLYLLNKEPKAKFAHVGSLDVIVFNPVYPEWVSIAYEFCVLIYYWLNFTINLLLASSEDEQLAVGSADFEISGTIYTIVVDEIRKIKKSLSKELIQVFTSITDTVLKILSWNNLALYYQSDMPDIQPLVESAFSDIKNGVKISSETKKDSENIAQYTNPTFNFTFTKLVLDIMETIAKKAELAKELIKKIPKNGPIYSFKWTLQCIIVQQLSNKAIIVIDCYLFQEKYKIDQQSQFTNRLKGDSLVKGLKPSRTDRCHS
ncbi:MAG: hypothetical protein HRT70_07205, partial [Flavobacteriaceae bacterium]|nr:hypothetical protein [Flavobacteriaceae bacterium]